VARRFGQAHVTRHDGAEHLVAEVLQQLPGDLVAEVVADVVHGAQQALHRQLRVDRGLHGPDRLEQLAEPIEGVELALDRDQHAVGRGQRIQRQYAQTRRTVDQHVVVPRLDRFERVAQAEFAPRLRHQPHLGRGQVAVPGQEIEAVRGGADRLLDAGLVQQHLAAGRPGGLLVHPRAHGGVPLRVEIDQQHLAPRLGERRGEVDAGRGLTHAALLVGDGDDPCHGFGPSGA
jgi:hypothetical protein